MKTETRYCCLCGKETKHVVADRVMSCQSCRSLKAVPLVRKVWAYPVVNRKVYA